MVDEKSNYYKVYDELNFDDICRFGQDLKLKNVEYVESNKGKNRSVWQGEKLKEYYNDNYNIPLEKLKDGEVLMVKGRYLTKNYEENNVKDNVREWSERYLVKKEDNKDKECKLYKLSYKEAVEHAQE